jgi:8-oxo-dGTP diphosphatase
MKTSGTDVPKLLIVRHAHAGDRGAWVGDDALRPLSTRGRRQADELARSLTQLLLSGGSSVPPTPTVRSSPADRCQATVAPLALQLRVPLVEDPSLFEGAAVEPLLASISALSHDEVWCSHGDVIPALLHRLAERGVDLGPDPRCRKGSVWALEVKDGQVVQARGFEPPA